VLSIGKLGAGQQSYYLESVSNGVEDYYSGRGEAPGRWVGAGAPVLGLDGRVNGDDLRAALEGVDPTTGTALGRARSDRVPGFDLTFRAPKSVSVLFGLGGFEASAEVHSAHQASVDAALGYLEREACWSRRGTNGTQSIAGQGFVGAAFRHRSSRAGDPHLHTHVLVANTTRAADGRWATLDARHIYLHAKTAGYLYEAHLRAELTRRLGVAWQPVVNGIADIEGIPDSVLRAFSTRRAEIEAEMTRRGVSSPRAAEIAALDTRQAKDYTIDPLTMTDRWWQRAGEFDIDRDTITATMHRAEPSPLTENEKRRTAGDLLGPDGLTERASSFDRRAVLRAWCERFRAGSEIAEIEALADRTLAEPEVVALAANVSTSLRTRARGRRIDGPDLGTCYSTIELLALEQRLVDQAVARRDEGAGAVASDIALAALAARPEISDEQAAMVLQLTTGGRGVDVVIAAAGTGKTFALDAARDAWQRQGHHVIGAALAARAAAELEATAGIRSDTIASLLADLDREYGGLPARSVLVIDEAGMVGTRTLGRLLDHVERARAKAVLVGDPRQLPEIDAGGLLRGLGARLEPIQLTHNRRQHNPWERAALAALRTGDVHHALAAYREHDRIVTHPTASQTRDAMAADWWAASLRHDRVLMVAARWSDVDDLNARARQRVASSETLSGPTIEIDGRPYQAGDRVVTLRNQRRLGVRNGTIATITDIDVEARAMTIRTDAATSHQLSATYLDAGHLRHAYATTIHKAQGATVDQVLVLGDDALYQEAAYVALSRGRANNRLYLVNRPDDVEQHAPTPSPEPLDAFAASLRVSRAQHLAIDHGSPAPSPRRILARRYDELQRLRHIDRAAPRNPTFDIDALQRSRTIIQSGLDEHQARLAELSKKRPLRHRREHEAEQLVTAERVERLARNLEETNRALADTHTARADYDGYQARHHADIEQLPRVEREVEALLSQLVYDYRTDPPAYLATLGPWPTDETRRDHWTEAATLIEDYRHRAYVSDPKRPFGAVDRTNDEQQLAQARVDQALRHITPERYPQRGAEIEL
jgi:conjugative relaxase-like TrwC/TraI family protein